MHRQWLVALLLIAPGAFAVETLQASEVIETTALAVAEGEAGFRGVSSTLQARVIAGGTGQVFVDTKPLSETDMQASARLAARVAADALGLDWTEYDYLIVLRSSSSIIGGPSAGGVMALAVATALHNLAEPDQPWTLDPRVAATGTINPDGTIGPVGGIPAKAEGARDAGIRTFLYPAGQSVALTRTLVNGTVADVLVDMDTHCQQLRITCRPAATLRDLIEAAAGVTLVLPDVAVPDTSVYEAYLGPSVRDQVAQLRTDIDAIVVPDVTPAQQEAIEVALAQAEDWSSQAEAALEESLFYQAATFSFRGNIQARTATLLAEAFGTDTLAPVADARDQCIDEADDAFDSVAGQAPRDLTGWLAMGAAQVRAVEAQALAAGASEAYAAAQTASGLASATETIAFCLERAGSVGWWAGLSDIFPPGGDLGDARGLVLDLMDRAREAIAYTDAVGAGGANGDLGPAEDLLAMGWLPGAALRAVEAEVDAALALQTVAGTIADETLIAARDTAARAVVQARLAGDEPVVSVALVELAATANGAAALSSYWQARTLALLGPVEPQEPTYRNALRTPDQDRAAMTFAFATGIIAASGIWLMAYIGTQLSWSGKR